MRLGIWRGKPKPAESARERALDFLLKEADAKERDQLVRRIILDQLLDQAIWNAYTTSQGDGHVKQYLDEARHRSESFYLQISRQAKTAAQAAQLYERVLAVRFDALQKITVSARATSLEGVLRVAGDALGNVRAVGYRVDPSPGKGASLKVERSPDGRYRVWMEDAAGNVPAEAWGRNSRAAARSVLEQVLAREQGDALPDGPVANPL